MDTFCASPSCGSAKLLDPWQGRIGLEWMARCRAQWVENSSQASSTKERKDFALNSSLSFSRQGTSINRNTAFGGYYIRLSSTTYCADVNSRRTEQRMFSPPKNLRILSFKGLDDACGLKHRIPTEVWRRAVCCTSQSFQLQPGITLVGRYHLQTRRFSDDRKI